jgi:hypothetical protein
MRIAALRAHPFFAGKWEDAILVVWCEKPFDHHPAIAIRFLDSNTKGGVDLIVMDVGQYSREPIVRRYGTSGFEPQLAPDRGMMRRTCHVEKDGVISEVVAQYDSGMYVHLISTHVSC